MSRKRSWVVAGGVSLVFLAWLVVPRAPTPKASENTYVDSRQCQGCHAAIYSTYRHVGMFRSFATIARAPVVEDSQFTHTASGRHYQVVRRGSQVFQRRFELDSSGREINAFELDATHVVGSGNHARTYLHRSAIGEFTELPLTWYSQDGWRLSPGFDQASPPDFTRIVDDRCLFCHNGYPDASGKPAEGIDCQRCHGPGSHHIELASSGRAAAAAIVNPARLSSELQLEVCMQCHLEPTSAPLPSMIRRFGRDVYSLRPGEPLGGYAIWFDEEPRTEKFEIAGQAYRLRQSECFLKSSGRLTCTTCHNPHDVKHGTAALPEYRAKCRGCHSSVAVAKHPDLDSSDCIACHMPKRRTEDAVHVVMTDHRIQRKPQTELAKRPPLGTPSIYYPLQLSEADRDIYLGTALILNAGDRRRGIGLLERQIRPDTPAKATAVLAEGYFAEGDAQKAIETFRRALAADPGIVKARYNLGQALELAGNMNEARQEYEHALRLQPAFPEAEYALANLLMKTGDLDAAGSHYQAAIGLRPTYAEPHVDLARVLASQGRIPDAIVQVRRAVAIDPNNAVAHYNLGRLLHETGSSQAAIGEYRRALGIHPEFAEAHLSLGQLFGDSGQLDAAIAEFREVLRLRPGHVEAQRNLDMALEMRRAGQ